MLGQKKDKLGLLGYKKAQELEKIIEETEKKIETIEKSMSQVQQTISTLTQKVNGFEQTINTLAQKVNGFEQNIGKNTTTINAIAGLLGAVVSGSGHITSENYTKHQHNYTDATIADTADGTGQRVETDKRTTGVV